MRLFLLTVEVFLLTVRLFSCHRCLRFLVLEPHGSCRIMRSHGRSCKIMPLKMPESAWFCLILSENAWWLKVPESASGRGGTVINSVQTGCIVKGKAQKSPLFWRSSGSFWFSQDRLLSRNSTRKPLNLIKSPSFTNAPCTSTCLYNAPSMHTVDVSRKDQTQFPDGGDREHRTIYHHRPRAKSRSGSPSLR